ncbi:MAG: glycosyltransferase family 2 protein [Proteobacteria bacterium]|nr:glycosyltransferase family 2 protein [Pseudomonadota bacterium]MCP4916018.1 glycosyltransferase family 2 protein [Pseudomonadota bacterium]
MIVVVPHHAGPLNQALAACGAHPVLVVDDRSSGEPLSVDHVRTAGSIGFARAANAGLAEAERRGHARALLLNDDAAPEPGCIEALLHACSDEVALAGPVLVGPSGIESAGIRFDPRTGRLRQRTDVPDSVSDVDALSGACLLMRSTMRFDEGFPHAMEDVELAQRVDGRVLIVPNARCMHLGGASVDRASRRATRDALTGHMRLVDSPLKRGLVTGYAVVQVLREGNRRQRLLGIVEALTQS